MNSVPKDASKGEVVFYKNKLEVRLEEDTVWLSQKQMAELFDKDTDTISLHIKNIYKEGELSRKATTEESSVAQKEGQRIIHRKLTFYNLDMIISVGYRVNSKRGTEFRIWATQVLKKHLVEGYTLNQRRLQLATKKYQELKTAVSLIGNVTSLKGLPQEAVGIAQVISQYTRALDLLDDFDHERLKTPTGSKKASFTMSYGEAQKIIFALKKKFKSSSLVGQEKDNGFKSSLGAIYQTFGGKDLYPSVQQKAAHLLYFVTKNHSFVDGNKRIAAALFICFLDRNKLLLKRDGAKRIDESALVALTLMIAASKPQEKDSMIKVVLNLLN